MRRRWYRSVMPALTVMMVLVLAGCGVGQPAGSAGGEPAAPEPKVASQAPAAVDPAEVYRGKTVTIITGFGAGGGYDLYGRLLAKHLGKHIPGNPNVIVKNMPGAGSMVAANHVYNTLDGDPLTIGSFTRSAPLEDLLGNEEVRFDTMKFNWLGSLGEETNICMVRGDSPVQSIKDATTTSIRVASDAPGSASYTFPLLLNAFVGTKFELITGYSGGSSERLLALERGEVGMVCQTWSATVSKNQDWLDSGFVKVIVQNALAANPDIPKDVPVIVEIAKDDQARNLMEAVLAGDAMGRPYTLPPGVPAEQVKVMRKAFMATAADPEFLADAKKQDLGIVAMSGDKMEEIMARIFKTPESEVAALKELLQP